MGHLVFEGNLYNVNHLIDFIAILYNTGVLLHERYIIFFTDLQLFTSTYLCYSMHPKK